VLGGKLLHQFRVLGGPDKANQRTAFTHQRHLIATGRTHLEHNIRCGPECGGICQHLGTGGAVGIVAAMGRIARTRFDSDLEAEFDQFFHDVRHRRHTLFSGKGLPGHADALDR